ncbi:Putative cell wall binding repeat-containing protein [Lachnospiraceae bacterium NE2001]|nr:Putative cell wall binding repeat-containing protein [Lachnospiraceae bacterium NE2001]
MKKMKKLMAALLASAICFSTVVSGTNVTEAASGTWQSDSTGWWYEYSDGSYASSKWEKIGGSWYYFKSNGYMDAGGYRDGCWLNGDGSWDTRYSGGKWASNDTGWWYTDASGWYPTSQWLQIDGNWYYFKDSGYMAANEWIGDYYLDSDGIWSPGKQKYSGAWVNAYKDVINDYETKNNDNNKYYKVRYALIYVDGDDIPELVCCKTGSKVSLYTYYNNKAVCVMDNWAFGAGGNSGYNYGEKTGYVSNGNSDMAGSLHYTTYWKLENGELKKTEYYLCSALFDYKKYGASWSHAEDMDKHYYKILTSSKGKKSDYQEITKEVYDSLSISTPGYISGGQTKDQILSEFN